MSKSNPLNPGFYGSEDLRGFGLAEVGSNVQVAKNITIIGPENIYLGNNIRIDGNTVINAYSGFLKIRNFVHIGGGSFLSCGGGIEFYDFSTISQGVRVYSNSDDYSGEFMTNPMLPKKYTNTVSGLVRFHEHVIVGSGTVVLPNSELFEGAAVGALALVNKPLESWGVYGGVPVRYLKPRSKGLLDKLMQFENEWMR
jgi:acetyltransferase-like isoleucine patch superfamily enzyme